MANMSEFQHQKAVFDWSKQESVRRQYPDLKYLFHIPNGGRRDVVEAKHLQESGVRRGVPDLFLPVPRGEYHGLWIEMKTETGRTRPEQDWWIENLMELGYAVEVCHGWTSATRVLEWYLSL